MDAVRATSHDIHNLYNFTTSIATSINFHQLILHIRSVFANLCDSLSYIQTGFYTYHGWITSMQPHQEHCLLTSYQSWILQRMLNHIADTLPPTLHLPISPEDTLHFYRYHVVLHVLIENKQFLLLIDMPIQDRSQQITIHEILTLDIPHGNYSAHYDVDTKYLGITKDATMAVELSTTQFQSLPRSKQSILQHHHTVSTISKPTILYSSLICKEHCRYYLEMLTTNMKSINYKFTYPDSTRCLDSYHTTCSSSKHLDIDYVLRRPWRPS